MPGRKKIRVEKSKNNISRKIVIASRTQQAEEKEAVEDRTGPGHNRYVADTYRRLHEIYRQFSRLASYIDTGISRHRAEDYHYFIEERIL